MEKKLESLLNTWGEWNPEDMRPVALWLLTQLQERRAIPSESWPFTARLIQRLNFDESEQNTGRVAYWQSAEKRARAIRTPAKPGKAFRKALPFASDSLIAELVDSYRAAFDNRELTLHIGKDALDFARAYTGEQCAQDNPAYGSTRKPLYLSCMRYQFESLPTHPACAYASGDFRVAWVEDSACDIVARVVIQIASDGEPIDSPQAGPMYGNTESGFNKLSEYLESIGAEFATSWQGATLRAIEYDGGFVVPYLDTGDSLGNNGNCLLVTRYGELSGSETGGVAYDEDSCQCSDCSARIDSDESYSDDRGNQYCESCYYERFGFCDNCEDTVEREDMVMVNRIDGRGRAIQECVCEHCANNDYIETHDGEFWHESDTVELADGGVASTVDVDSGDIVETEDGELYLATDCGELSDGGFRPLAELHADSCYELRGFLWHMTQLELPLAA